MCKHMIARLPFEWAVINSSEGGDLHILDSKNSKGPPAVSPGPQLAAHAQIRVNRTTHGQIHADVRAVQQQDPAGDGGPRRAGGRDVDRRSSGDHRRRVDDLLLVGQEQGVPTHPSSSCSRTVLLVPLSRLEAAPTAERPAQKPHHLPDPGGAGVSVRTAESSSPALSFLPRGEESLSGHGGDFGAACQSPRAGCRQQQGTPAAY